MQTKQGNKRRRPNLKGKDAYKRNMTNMEEESKQSYRRPQMTWEAGEKEEEDTKMMTYWLMTSLSRSSLPCLFDTPSSRSIISSSSA